MSSADEIFKFSPAENDEVFLIISDGEIAEKILKFLL